MGLVSSFHWKILEQVVQISILKYGFMEAVADLIQKLGTKFDFEIRGFGRLRPFYEKNLEQVVQNSILKMD